MAVWIIIAGLALVRGAPAQEAEMDWYYLDGGGGGVAAQGGPYGLHGTTGHYGTGTQSGDPYSLAGGYWSIGVQQTVGAPILEIVHLDGQLRLQWLITDEPFVLEACADLNPAFGRILWTEIPPPYTSNDTHSSYIVPTRSDFQVYRLALPEESNR
jgi:hypothetical protein